MRFITVAENKRGEETRRNETKSFTRTIMPTKWYISFFSRGNFNSRRNDGFRSFYINLTQLLLYSGDVIIFSVSTPSSCTRTIKIVRG